MAALRDSEKSFDNRLSRFSRIDLLLVALLAFVFLIRLYGIENPLVDFSSWRQIDTASIARHFVESDFNLLHPQLLYDGPGNNYSQLELQITTFFIALFFKLIGMRDLYARLVPVLFFIGSALFLYLLVKRYYDKTMARLTVLIYAILPMGVYYGRAVQPEAAMLFFGIASLYFYSVWLEKQTTATYLLAVAIGALSVLAKIPNAFLLLPIAIMAFTKFGKRSFVNKQVLAYFAIVLAVTAAYFGYLGWFVSIAGSPYDYHNYVQSTAQTGNFVSNIASKHVMPQLLTAFTSPEGKQYFGKHLINMVLTPIGFVLMLFGLIPFGIKKHDIKNIAPFYAWAITIVLFIMTIAAIIKIDYYLVPVLPVAAFFIARALREFVIRKTTWPLALLLIGIIGCQSYVAVSPLYNLDNESYATGVELQKQLRPGEPVILGAYNPAILYYSGHKGWRSIDLSLDEFLFLRSEGAGYYIPLNSTQDKRLIEYLGQRYVLQTTKTGCRYYDLKR